MRGVQRGISTLIILIIFLIAAVAIASGYFVFSQKQKLNSINSFEDCAKYYPVMKSYPGQCNTPDGKHFVQELSEEEKKKLNQPSTINDLMPARTSSEELTPQEAAKNAPLPNETANWKVLRTNKILLNYPPDWILYQHPNPDVYFYEIQTSQDFPDNLLRIFTGDYGLRAKNTKLEDLAEEIKDSDWDANKGFKNFGQELIKKEKVKIKDKIGIRYSIKLNNPKNLKFNLLNWIYMVNGTEVTVINYEGNNVETLEKILSTMEII